MDIVVKNGLTTFEIDQINVLFKADGFNRLTDFNQHIYREVDGHSPICSFFYQDNNSLGALYAAVPKPFVVDGASVVGYQSLDTLVDAKCRGQGLFQKTALTAYDEISKSDYPLIYGFPNGNSFHGFKKYLDWKFLDPVPFLVRPIKVNYFFKKIYIAKFFNWFKIPSLSFHSSVQIIDKFPEENELSNLCESFLKTYSVGVRRSFSYLKSRFSDIPGKKYRYCVLRNLNQIIVGFGIFCVEEKHGGKIGYIMEIIHLQDEPSIVRPLLAKMVNECALAGCDCVLAWCFPHSTSYLSYLANIFIPLPVALRPIELHFGVRIFDSKLAGVILNRKNWYVSYLDSDTV